MKDIVRARLFTARLCATLLGLCAPAAAQLAPATVPIPEDVAGNKELATVTRELCRKEIVILGENGFHGDGKTMAFKAEIVRDLIEKCRFRAVYFESSFYDFLAIDRAIRVGQPVTTEMVASAIGGKWNYSEDLKPLIPFLRSAAEKGRIGLGGLDDQLGARGMFYSLEQMPVDLAKNLNPDVRQSCQAQLRRRIWSDFPRESPYSTADRDRLLQCTASMKQAIQARQHGATTARDDLAMIASIERALSRDFQQGPQFVSGRDASMDENFRWLAGRLPRHAKVIIWTANEHATRDPAAADIFGGGSNLGTQIAKKYGHRAFALGFSAASGSYRWSSREVKQIAPAPSGSLEASAEFEGGAAYLDNTRLRALKSRQGALYGHKYVVADWSKAFDGVVVFQEERPPR